MEMLKKTKTSTNPKTKLRIKNIEVYVVFEPINIIWIHYLPRNTIPNTVSQAALKSAHGDVRPNWGRKPLEVAEVEFQNSERENKVTFECCEICHV